LVALLELGISRPGMLICVIQIDSLRLSSGIMMTLFAEAAPDEEIFQKVLDKFFGGKKDDKPLRIIGR
jgi:uncharacterized protein (DUF1810 family)